MGIADALEARIWYGLFEGWQLLPQIVLGLCEWKWERFRPASKSWESSASLKLLATLWTLIQLFHPLTILIMVNRKIAVDAFNGIFPPESEPYGSYPPPTPQ
jgi:hypothetical protein